MSDPAARFASLVALAEKMLRAGEYGPTLNAVVAEMSELAATSDAVKAALAEDDWLGDHFDAVVAAGRELRGEAVAEHVRCRDCPGALHTADNCPFRWGES